MALARLNRENLSQFKARIAKLTPDTKPLWGGLTAAKLLTHLRTVVEMSLEEREFPDRSTWFTRNIVRLLAFHVMPAWPKGKIKAPDEFTPESGEAFDKEREKLLGAFDRFTEAAAARPRRRTRHALFGDLTLEYWTFMHARHFEHHFQQFGI